MATIAREKHWTTRDFEISILILKKSDDFFCWNFEVGAVQKSVNVVDLVKSLHKSISLQKSASIQPRTSLSKFGGDSVNLFIRLLKPTSQWTSTSASWYRIPLLVGKRPSAWTDETGATQTWAQYKESRRYRGVKYNWGTSIAFFSILYFQNIKSCRGIKESSLILYDISNFSRLK